MCGVDNIGWHRNYILFATGGKKTMAWLEHRCEKHEIERGRGLGRGSFPRLYCSETTEWMWMANRSRYFQWTYGGS